MLELTQDILKEQLSYNNGILVWIKSGPKRKIGSPAGYTNPDGYTIIKLFRKSYLRHRLNWLYFYGVWPSSNLDHIDGIPGNDHIENLREATTRQNSYNTSSRSSTTSKYKGVYWHKSSGKWMVRIRNDGERKYVGIFDNEEVAAKSYDDAAREIHKEFMKPNLEVINV